MITNKETLEAQKDLNKIVINWEKVKQFTFITSTQHHSKRKVIAINDLKKCVKIFKT